MPKFVMMLPNNETIDMTEDILQSKSEEDVKEVLVKTLKKEHKDKKDG